MSGVQRVGPSEFSDEVRPKMVTISLGPPSAYPLSKQPRVSSQPTEEDLATLKTKIKDIQPSLASEIGAKITGFITGIIGFAIGATIALALVVATFGLIFFEEKGRELLEKIIVSFTKSFALIPFQLIKDLSVKLQQNAEMEKLAKEHGYEFQSVQEAFKTEQDMSIQKAKAGLVKYFDAIKKWIESDTEKDSALEQEAQHTLKDANRILRKETPLTTFDRQLLENHIDKIVSNLNSMSKKIPDFMHFYNSLVGQS